MEKARKMRKYDLESQELNKKGIRPKVSRQEKKRRMRLSKTERFVERLRNRGGYKPDSFDDNVGKDIIP